MKIPLFSRREVFLLEGDKLIYSKRYLDPVLMEAMAETPFPEERTAEEKAETERSLADFWRRVKNETHRVLMPERVEPSQQFIQLAKELAEAHKIDIEIWEKAYFIQVNLLFHSSLYAAPVARDLAKLLNMCDTFSTLVPSDRSGDLTLLLDFYTHKYYMSGRLINI